MLTNQVSATSQHLLIAFSRWQNVAAYAFNHLPQYSVYLQQK